MLSNSLLNIYYYIHRFVLLLALVRKAPYYSGYCLMQSHNFKMLRKSKRECSVTEGTFTSPTSQLRAQGTLQERRVKRMKKWRRVWKKAGFWHDMAIIYTHSQQLYCPHKTYTRSRELKKSSMEGSWCLTSRWWANDSFYLLVMGELLFIDGGVCGHMWLPMSQWVTSFTNLYG